MRIRPADLADAASIARFHVRSWQETYRGLMPAEFLNNLSIEQRTETWARILGELASTNFVFVLEDDQEHIVGLVSSGAERDELPDYDAEVYAIYVSHTLHGQGWGRKLFEHSLSDLKQRGFSSMMLWVLKDNPSRGFYEHTGGKLVSEREIELGGAKITEVAYGWEKI
jgi:ribosomal protein S18 acetylase RimI-like enzyme